MIKFSYTTVFNKNIKQLGKKYPSLADDLIENISLEEIKKAHNIL